MKYLFYDHKHFDRVLNQLWKKGGPYQNAVKDIEALLYRVFKDSTASKDHDPFRGLRLTKYGESRIRNCVKYDLNGFSRLVTIQSHGYCY